MEVLATAALAGLSVAALLLARRVRALLVDVAELSGRVTELAARLDATEHDAAGALARTEVAELVLLDKGLADEEDLEAARRRFGDDVPPADVRGDGELH
ncbi:MAG TPA: hypothetical protein VF912_05830 [Anaeromyxobacter sp.]